MTEKQDPAVAAAQATLAIAFLLGAICLVQVWKFAQWIGAAFEPTLYALLVTVLGVAAAGAILWREYSPLLMAVLPWFIWPFWCRVLDSRAAGPDQFSRMLAELHTPWWATTWFQLSIELLLIGLPVGYVLLSERSRRPW